MRVSIPRVLLNHSPSASFSELVSLSPSITWKSLRLLSQSGFLVQLWGNTKQLIIHSYGYIAASVRSCVSSRGRRHVLYHAALPSPLAFPDIWILPKRHECWTLDSPSKLFTPFFPRFASPFCRITFVYRTSTPAGCVLRL